MNVEESLDRPTYLDAVEEIQRRIVAGKCYEVNLSRRVTLPRSVDPHKLFDALCESSPAPFAAYMDLGDEILVGSSPERFLRIRGREAISSPIKGTAARHADPAADKLAGSALKGSRKDRAENVMIVDLVRNDLGRVCDAGSVRVRRLCELESFAGVHHLVSTISGTLGESHDALDAVQALFPPGSMTGAPKIAAMKVIESLEPVRRGPYAGAAGYLSATGDADLSVVIRSFVISPGRVDLQLGGAVVADSSPAAEYQETVIKGDRALAGLKKAVIGDQGSRGGESGKRRRLVAATPSVS
jgi:anthranilate/para-aminobenzoate synthase component I